MKHCICIFIVFVFLSSCAVQNSMYVWEDYQMSLARYTEKPNNSTRNALEGSLFKVISSSAQQKKRVPPGIYLQYGYLLSLEGKLEMASQYYLMEKTNYPESSVLVDELETKLK